MRATPALLAAGVMYLLGRQRGKRRRRALPAAANLAARRVTDLAEAARRLRPRSRNGRITLGRPHPVTFLGEHPWTVFGAAASVLAAGMWGLWRRAPGHIRMATTIEAPIERVFDAWSRFEDFPRFMPMVAQVRQVGDDRWQWTISEPDGASIEFVSRVTQRDRPHVIGWATDGGMVGEHSGTVRFRSTDSGTRMEVEMSRHASGGAVGEGVAVAAGVDPERALREGLAAFKARLEEARHSPDKMAAPS
jgi:uncharacterized membrane protein